jgi:hypothetical protein
MIFTKETRAGGTRGRTLHFPGKVAAGEDTGTLAEAVGNLISIDALEGDPDPETRSANVVLDKDKLSLLSFRDIRE